MNCDRALLLFLVRLEFRPYRVDILIANIIKQYLKSYDFFHYDI